MYFFLIFGLPLGFILLVIDVYPAAERSTISKAFARGLASFIPIWIVARILGAIVPAVYGSVLLALHEWADRFLPYALLPALAYLVFYKPGERLHPGVAIRRFTAFYVGALSPTGLCEAARIWGSPEPYALFLLPVLLGAICLAMPQVAARSYSAYGAGLAGTIALFVVASLIASLCPYLFLVRLWPLALIITAAVGAGAWYFSYPELSARPPTSYS